MWTSAWSYPGVLGGRHHIWLPASSKLRPGLHPQQLSDDQWDGEYLDPLPANMVRETPVVWDTLFIGLGSISLISPVWSWWEFFFKWIRSFDSMSRLLNGSHMTRCHFVPTFTNYAKFWHFGLKKRMNVLSDLIHEKWPIKIIEITATNGSDVGKRFPWRRLD